MNHENKKATGKSENLLGLLGEAIFELTEAYALMGRDKYYDLAYRLAKTRDFFTGGCEKGQG